ncbi:putative flagellar basal body protein [Tribonema minus]|uniref:Putative flagellar basal body protein n=1 Tax=Tribonema minus TaxID=303371 RepID=A0A835YNS8_9STRA|nr:putative flagellar basal body protein [Tribonema minus]
MVVLNIKRSDTDSFLCEATCSESNDALVRRLARMWNTRVRLMYLVGAVRELAQHGPYKPEAEHGIDEIKEQYEGVQVNKGEFYRPDPTGKRTGNGVSPQLMETIERVCQDAEMAVSKAAASKEQLDEKLDNIRGAVTMAYPMGLPLFDPVRLAIEGKGMEGLDGTSAQQELMDEDTAGLWMAGKEFRRDQTVADRIGKNEKTKATCKLQRSGAGPPCREPAVSEEERKAMMAFYFKRQEEMKKLAEANDDDYLGSAWADPRQLQKSLRGTGAISAPGVRKL